jgi:TetR/AcrR family transcriptional regulator
MIKSNNQNDRRDGDTEARILEAAREVLERRGTAGARMAEIAEQADVNQALLHYYFGSKAKLAEAVFQRAARDLLPAVLDVLMSEADLPKRCGGWCRSNSIRCFATRSCPDTSSLS